MNDRKAAVLVLVAIMTAVALLTGCMTNPLVWSVWRGSVSKVEKHIDEGADVDTRYELLRDRVLNLAVRRGNGQVTHRIRCGYQYFE